MAWLYHMLSHSGVTRQFVWRLGVAGVCICLLIVCEGAANAFIYRYEMQVENFHFTVNTEIDAFYRAMLNQETGIRGYISTGEEAFLDPFTLGRARYTTAFASLKAQVAAWNLSSMDRAVENSRIAADRWYNEFALKALNAMKMHNYVFARSLAQAKLGMKLFDSFRSTITILRNEMMTSTGILQEHGMRLSWSAIIGAPFLSLLTLLLVWYIVKRNSRSLQVLEAQESFRRVLDGVPGMIWIVNGTATELEYGNRQWCDYTGLCHDPDAITHWKELIHPDDFTRCCEIWAKAIVQRETYEVEYRMKGVDNCYRWHLVRGLPMQDRDGKLLRWFGTSTNIDDLKHFEEALIQTNHAQQNFVATVSHEFRTSLTSIQGFSELMYEQELERDEMKEYSRDIHGDSQRLERMLTDLLDLEKMRTGKMELYKEWIDINQLLRDTVKRMSAVSPNHTIQTLLDESLPSFEADADRVVQVLVNLLSNAVKYSPPGDLILVRSYRENKHVHLEVQDKGLGIPKDALNKVFQPYNRVSVEETKYIKGTGLGLPIVRQIVEMHGGRVWVESEPGEGSIFHVTLPLENASAQVSLPAAM